MIKNELREAAAYLQSRILDQTKTGIVLGTGLGGLVNKIEIEASIPYEQIPHFPVSLSLIHISEPTRPY